MLISANAYAYSRPRASASSESSAMAGVQKLPKLMLAATTSTARTAARPGHGRPAVAIADASASTVIGPDSTDPVGDAADDRVRGRLERRRAEPEDADRDGREPELVEPQRRQDAQRPEEERGQDDEPDAELDRRLRSARMKSPDRLGFLRRRLRGEERPDGEPTATRAAAPKATPRPTTDATPPSTGPKSAPTIAAAIAVPIVCAASCRGRRADQPGQAGRPGEGAAEALREAGQIEHHDRVRRARRSSC